MAQVARFSLKDVEADVLKTLYESLVDPAERHDLGEYYTPDWLAYRVVAEAVDAPLTQRVLDPACGSGTFLFHALRRLVAAGKYAGWPSDKILTACANQVFGLDVHPVAVTLARVTWLLALSKLLPERVGRLTVPVFLGDAMQWNLRQYIGHADVLVDVPGEPPLQVPTGFAEDQARFEHALDEMNQGLRDEDDPEAVGRRLARIAGATPADATRLAVTFGQMQALYRSGRNGIWTFVLRNLVRPVWLSRPEQRADVLVGNPPWIVYRHLSPSMKDPLARGLGRVRALGRRTSRDPTGHVRAVLGARGGAVFEAAWANRVRAALRGAERAGVRRAARRRDGQGAGRRDWGLVAGAGLADFRRRVRRRNDEHVRFVRDA